MPSPSTTVAALRTMLAVRFPERSRSSEGVIPTGVRPIDAALGGGLPIGRLTELVSSAAGTGGQTILAQLLRTTRAARQRVALIDGANGFAPHALPPDLLRHVVWIRAHDVGEAFAAADILARDGNYSAVVFDLRGLAERALLKIPASAWHRLRYALDDTPSAFLVQTGSPLVPAVHTRLVLTRVHTLESRRISKTDLANLFNVEVVRGHLDAEEKIA